MSTDIIVVLDLGKNISFRMCYPENCEILLGHVILVSNSVKECGIPDSNAC
jgi:hypothetical protein